MKYGLTAACVAFGTISAIPVALAESPKSIYDDEDSELVAPVPGTISPSQNVKQEPALTESKVIAGVNVRTSTNLERNIEVSRKWLASNLDQGQKKVDKAFENYFSVEQSVTSTVAGLKDDSEEILPGAIYILTALLSGSIVTRNRNFVLRAAAPLAFGWGAFWYFLPKTYKNTAKLAWTYEQKVPALADAHAKTQNQIETLVTDAQGAVNEGKQVLENGVHKARQIVADTTGLQIGDNSKDNKK